MDEKTFQKVRLYCHITWAVIEPVGLVVLIWMCLRIIALLKAIAYG